VAGAPTQTLTITDNEPPEVSVIAGIAPSEAGPTDGNFIFTRTPSEAATTVNYTVAGTATAGDDYTALAGSVTIPASATNTTVQVAVPALDDLVGEGDETIEVTLTADPAAYTIATGVAILTLADNDGTAGADNLAGSTGDDIIAGGAGDDVINGNSGNDVLVGEAGNDDLTGGDGADLFRFNATTEGTDTIQDFVVGTDKIQATTGAFGAIPVGALPVANFVTGAAATAAAPQFIYNAGALSFDADGTGAGVPVLLANLTGAPVLTATDIEIV
jgi:Ca2+-binding RTX toxin-like protein